jgi:hypothetical protein
MYESWRQNHQLSWPGNDGTFSELIVPLSFHDRYQLPTLVKMPVRCKHLDIVTVV